MKSLGGEECGRTSEEEADGLNKELTASLNCLSLDAD